MVKPLAREREPLDQVFAALADPTRRAILARLTRGEASVGELAEPFEISAPAISKHLKVLESAGLITRERDWRIHRLHLEAEPLREAMEWIVSYGRFWDAQLDSLERFVTSSGEPER
jgi:DNA-binding transcriptional ArsR family regulator